MKNYKIKFMSFVLVIMMLLSIISTSAIANEANTSVKDNSKDYFNRVFSDLNDETLVNITALLNSLGIMNGYEDNTFKPDKNMTRAEFVAMMVRYLGIDINTSEKEVAKEFIDVERGWWATKSIYAGVAQGFIKGITDTEFHPENTITYEQAVKIIVSVLGYDILAQSKGGYPNGYLLIASEKGLLKGVDMRIGDSLKRSDIAILIYNSLEIDIMEVTGIGNNIQYSIKKDKTILTERLKVYNDEGIVKGIYETALHNGDTNIKEDQVIIESNKYNLGMTKIKDLLGYKVKYYYKDFEDGKGNTIVFGFPLEENSVLEIEYDDYEGLNNYELSYAKDKSNKSESKTANISTKLDIIYNGKSVLVNDTTHSIGTYLNDTNKPFHKIKLVDNDSDSKYDVLFITQYDTYVVDSINLTSKNIVLKYPVNGLTTFNELDSDDDTKIIVIKKGNDLLNLKDIEPNDILSVSESKDISQGKKLYNVYVSTNIVDGDVTEISNEDDKTYTIGGKEYRIVKTYDFYLANENRLLSINDSGKFYIDFTGRIAYADVTGESTKKYGYLFKANVGAGINPKVQMEIFTMAGQFEIFDLTEKIDITYYPRYTPWAIYYGVNERERSAYDSKTIRVLEGSNVVDKTAYLYLDPIIRNDMNLNAVDVYNSTPDKIIAIEKMNIFRREYKEKNKYAHEVVKKYFMIQDRFDTEKMQLIRYQLDNAGKIESIETAKDYGFPYQWRDQGETEILNDMIKDREEDVFRISVKSPVYRNPETGARPLTNIVKSSGVISSGTEASLAYRYFNKSNAFFENLKEWSPRTGDGAVDNSYNGYTDQRNPSTTVSSGTLEYGVAHVSNENLQPALFFLSNDAILFTVPRPDAISREIGLEGLDTPLQPLNKSDVDTIRMDKNRYIVGKFTHEGTGASNYRAEAYNLDKFNSTTLLLLQRGDLHPVGRGELLLLVDRVVQIIDKNGNRVQKVYGYRAGKQVEYVANNDYVFNRLKELTIDEVNQLNNTNDTILYGKKMGQSLKRGDIVLIDKRSFENGYDIINHLFEYDDNGSFKFYKSLLATNPFSRTSLSAVMRNQNNAYFIDQNGFKGITNATGEVINNPNNASYGHIVTDKEDLGRFAGKVEDKNNNFIKMQFDENYRFFGDKVRYDRLDKKFQMPVKSDGEGPRVYIVKNNEIKIGTYDDIQPGDFIFAYYDFGKVLIIVKYEKLTNSMPNR